MATVDCGTSCRNRFCECAFSRVVMVVSGCDLNKYAVCMSVFMIHVRPFFEVGFALSVFRIMFAPRKVLE